MVNYKNIEASLSPILCYVSSLLKTAVNQFCSTLEFAQPIEKIVLELALVAVLTFVIFPYEFAVLLAAVLELPDKFERFSTLNALTMGQIVHKLSLVNHVSFFIGALAMGCVVLKLTLIAIAVSTNVPSNASYFIINGRCL